MRKLFPLWLLIAGTLYAQEVVHVIQIDGVINPVAQNFIHNNIEKAEEANAHALVIMLDTPGGLMKSMRMIVKDMLTASIPIVVYVAPSGSRAGSAGVFITLAAHVAAMAPGTNIGAAHPVAFGMGADTSQTMMEKVTNDAVAFIKSIAEKRGRNVEWAEQAVRKSVSITETEALELNVIDFIAPTLDSLLVLMDGMEVETSQGKVTLHTRNARIKRIEMSFRYRVLNVISDPNVAYILMLIGIYGILFELYNPGSIFPGVIGAISLILAFYALQTLPINYAGLLLIILAIILFLLEIKIPSYGLLTIGGIVSLVLGSLMLFESPLPFLRVSWKVIAAATLTTALFFLFAIGMGIRAQRKKPTTGSEGLVGEFGEAIETFRKGAGQVMVHGEIWKAKSRDTIRKGDPIRVTRVDGLHLRVQKVDEETE
ncbi:MAG: nodulation protein NfeD [Calditrichaeota bacterium]|nr:nodulation protein NfeD [Calditrichota bacterium]